MIKRLRDLYKPKHKEDAEQKDKTAVEVARYRKALKESGMACMSDPKFQRYRDSFIALERLTFDQARLYKNEDPIKYAMVVSNMFSELNTFQALIDDVTTDANIKLEATT